MAMIGMITRRQIKERRGRGEEEEEEEVGLSAVSDAVAFGGVSGKGKVAIRGACAQCRWGWGSCGKYRCGAAVA